LSSGFLAVPIDFFCDDISAENSSSPHLHFYGNRLALILFFPAEPTNSTSDAAMNPAPNSTTGSKPKQKSAAAQEQAIDKR
jgi:hypothetical protein